jgi:hypothetical protein
MPHNLTKVYDLKADVGKIAQYRNWMESEYCSLSSTCGAFGSEEWWGVIETGTLRINTLEGPILRADTRQTSGMLEEDYLEMEVADPESRGLSWNLHDDQTDRSQFTVGRHARLTYVMLPRKPLSSDKPDAIMLEVWLDLGDRV